MLLRPRLMRLGQQLLLLAMRMRLPVAWWVRPNLFDAFCGGESIEECRTTWQTLWDTKVGTALDYGAESANSEWEAELNFQQFFSALLHCADRPPVRFFAIKASALAAPGVLERGDPDSTGYKKTRARLQTLAKVAVEAKVPLFLDAEETWIQPAIDQLAFELMGEYNTERVWIYTTIQCYRRDGFELLTKAIAWADENKRYLGVKLVRGAYVEKERGRAERLNYPDRINPTKEATDQMYDHALLRSVKRLDRVWLVAATHNELSCRLLRYLMYKHQIPADDRRVVFAQLYGMSDPLSFGLAQNGGHWVSKYVPYGPLRQIIPYLLRRAEENRSVEGQAPREYLVRRWELRRRKVLRSR